MAGILYEWFDVGGGAGFSVRCASLYDASQYWYSVSSGERHGLGIIKHGPDYLMPSCDYEKDICSYTMGGSFFLDKACPHLTISSQGVPNENGGLAVFNHTNNGSSGYPSNQPPLGLYCSTVERYTNKVRGRDYETYDSGLHRDAGLHGVVGSAAAWSGRYESTPHGSLFYFDTNSSVIPTFCSLVATKNAAVIDFALRYDQYDPREQSYWSNFPFRGTEYSSSSGPNFYVANAVGGAPVFKTTKSLGIQIDIDGTTHDLYLIALDTPRQDVVYYKYFEPLWYKIQPVSGSVGSVYILDEWVTIHKPAA